MAHSTIILPTRPQADTLVAIFLLRTLGQERFPGVAKAAVEFCSVVSEEEKRAMEKKAAILLDLGGGAFDHHGKEPKTTVSDLVAEHLGVKADPALAKLLEYARRDDFFGKGTVSADPIDRAFGLSGLIAALNKTFTTEPARVVEAVLPLLSAHWSEEVRRTKEMPAEFERTLKDGSAEVFTVKQRGKNLLVVFLSSDNVSMAGFLRSQLGGRHDVVAQRLSSGHLNILTRPTKHVDLRSLATLVRLEEANLSGRSLDGKDARYLASPGRIAEVPEWYFDPATNSLQNGGVNPKDTPSTKIEAFTFRKLLEVGLSERLWNPPMENRPLRH